jgi:nucleoside-diphosphate-sugar epimerase
MTSTVIFGGGFIAKSLVEYLPPGHQITVVSRLSTAVKNIFPHVIALSTPNEISPSARYDVAVFCSGPSTPNGVSKEAAVHCTASLKASLRACRGSKNFIYVSSGGAFYEPSEQPMQELHPVDRNNSYALLHATNEDILRLDSSIPSRISLRLGNPFGRHQDPKRSVGFVTECVKCAIEGRELVIVGDGSTCRDFFHVKTISEAINFIWASSVAGFEPYNLATGTSHTLLEVISMVESVTGKSIKKHFCENGRVYRPTVKLMISKFKRDFPEVALLNTLDGVKLLGLELEALP